MQIAESEQELFSTIIQGKKEKHYDTVRGPQTKHQGWLSKKAPYNSCECWIE